MLGLLRGAGLSLECASLVSNHWDPVGSGSALLGFDRVAYCLCLTHSRVWLPFSAILLFLHRTHMISLMTPVVCLFLFLTTLRHLVKLLSSFCFLVYFNFVHTLFPALHKGVKVAPLFLLKYLEKCKVTKFTWIIY